MLEIAPLSSREGECTICLDKLQDGQAAIVRLVDCKHEFHGSCIETALSHSKKCPTCRKPVGKPQGAMPSGVLVIHWRPDLDCGGGFGPGTIVLSYQIDVGLQKSYHENPGVPHGGALRIAYLPMNNEGEKLLNRLKYAFSCGLTFTVGTSLTTGKPNSVTWSSIHHKTSLTGGAHGYPDAGYFINANEELDALNVPSADDL
jgi:deltex-like protein